LLPAGRKLKAEGLWANDAVILDFGSSPAEAADQAKLITG
jgi:hypothetical protein